MWNTTLFPFRERRVAIGATEGLGAPRSRTCFPHRQRELGGEVS